MNPQTIIKHLGLEPHPEGGYFKRTYCADVKLEGGRAAASSIYYFIEGDFTSLNHRTDGDEIWYYHAGAPLRLDIQSGQGPSQSHFLGMDFAAGQQPQICVKANDWQQATSMGNWTLVSCMVCPEFQFSSFELSEQQQAE